MSVRRVQVVWAGGPTAGGGLSTFYFDQSTGTAAQLVTAVGNFLAATEDQRATVQTWATDPDVIQLSETGVLESVVTTTPSSGVGIATGDPLSPTTQGLLRCLTNLVIAGRLLRGRLFLPGPTEFHNQAPGNCTPAYLADYNAAAAALIADANSVWKVWSRTHGASAAVTTANVWTSWAVLRSRRD